MDARTLAFAPALLLAAACSSPVRAPSLPWNAAAQVTGSVLQHHGNAKRTGLYVDPAFTRTAVMNLHLDTSFNASVTGPIYAQPLYASQAVNGKDAVIVATEQDLVLALDATTGAMLWQHSLGAPVPVHNLPCGDIDPLGITGTPVIDPASGTLFVDAMTTPDGGATKKHLIYALDVTTGNVLPGWPADTSTVHFGSLTFDPTVQNQRGALAFLNGSVYVPYGGHEGDCGDYHGWVIGVPLAHPDQPQAWATLARGGGSWAPGGIASDGTSLFFATGNTFGAVTWSGGEAIIRLGSGPVFSGQPADFFAPTDWQALDAGDIDIGGSGPILIDMPGATPPQIAVALGKNGKAYVLDASNLGGISDGLANAHVASNEIINAAATFPSASGAIVVFKGNGANCPNGTSGDLTAIQITPGAPPTITTAWCAAQNGGGSPMVTSTDGTAQPIVWSVGAEGDNRLHAFDGQTGAALYSSDSLTQVRRFSTPIAANGRVFVATDTGVVAFTTK